MAGVSRQTAAAIGLVLLTCLLYGSTLTNPLVWDDRELIVHHPGLRDASDAATLFGSPYWGADDYLYRPLTSWTLAVNYETHVGLGLPGEYPVGYHVANLLLHFAVGWLLFVLSRTLRLPYWPALAVALLFIVHPLRTEAVTSIVGRAELLAAVFGLAFLLLHRRRRGLPLGALCLLLALLSKESAAALLPLALWMDVCVHDGDRRFWWRGHAAYVGALVGWLTLRWVAVGGNPRGIPFLDNPLVEASTLARILTAARVQLDYLVLQLLPVGLSTDYSYHQVPLASLQSPRALVFLALVAVALWIAWRTRVHHPVVPFAVIGYAILAAPSSNFLLPIGTIMGERLTYGPSMLLCLLLGYGLSLLPREQGRVLAGALGVVILVLGVLTVSRNAVWSDAERFARAQVRSAPESARAHYTLGVVLHDGGKLQEAVESQRRAVAILHDYPEAWNELGTVYEQSGDLESAVEAYRQATAIFPGYLDAWVHLGQALRELGDLEGAVAARRRAVDLDPDSERAYLWLGIVSYELGDLEAAIRAYEQAIDRAPGFAAAYSNLGAVYARQGRFAEAQQTWRRALELDPDDASARNNLERLLQTRQP